MQFIEKVKKKLIEIKQKKIDECRVRNIKLKDERTEESEAIKQIDHKIELLKKEKIELEKDLLSKKTIDEYRRIKEFLIYSLNLKEIVGKINQAFDEYQKTDKMIHDGVKKRENLNDKIKELNSFINKILNEIEVLHSSEIEESILQIYEQLNSSADSNYYCILDDAYKNRTICINPIDEESIRKIIVIYSQDFLFSIPKGDAILLNQSKKVFEPMELWSNIEEYNGLMERISNIIDVMLHKFEQFKAHYKKKPELFDIRYLTEKIERAENGAKRTEEIIREKKEKRKELEKRRKRAKHSRTKNGRKNSSSYSNSKERNKISELETEIKAIKVAQTIQELGYDSKFDAAIELGIPTKDYIVIPAPKNIEKISQLFFTEKVLKVEVNGHIYYTTYVLNTASGRINNAEQLDDKKAVILIPIDDREGSNSKLKDAIVSSNKGIIELNLQALRNEGVLLIISNEDEISTEDLNGIKIKHSSQNLIDEVKAELGDDYTEEQDVTGDYKIFNGIKSVSDTETELKRKAVIDCIFENLTKVTNDEKTDIYVNEERFFYTSDEKQELQTRHNKGNIGDIRIEDIIGSIECFLHDDEIRGIDVDILYGKLLQEYLKYNRKAKADYYNEPNTMVQIGEKRISIKPPLAKNNSLIAEKYSRPNEDIAYKMMKLADLVNRFAHEYENAGYVDFSERIYDLKKDLIEKTIEFSRKNPNIKITTRKDERLSATYVAIEIPGYNVIALHIINATYSLRNSLKELKITDIDIPTKSTIMNGGVNEEFLTELLNMPFMERVEIIKGLNIKTFNKLLLRMGYSLDELKNEETKKALIGKIMSDETISDLLSKQRSESEFDYR